METPINKEELRKRLAINVMGWVKAAPHLNSIWLTKEGQSTGFAWKESGTGYPVWTPDLPTPQGFYQCFGEGGILEKMRALGWRVGFDWEPEKACFAAFHAPSGGLDRHFFGMVASTITLATCLAADKAMEEVIR